MIDEIKKHLENRIAELRKVDSDFCADRWNMDKPQWERSIARDMSNQVTFARQELDKTLKFLNELSKGDVIKSVCKHEWIESAAGFTKCYHCGEYDKY